MNRQLFEDSFDNNETESVTVQNFRQIQDAASCRKRGNLNFFFWGGWGTFSKDTGYCYDAMWAEPSIDPTTFQKQNECATCYATDANNNNKNDLFLTD